MKVTLAKIVNSAAGLRKLVNEPLPAKIAYRIKRIMDAVTSESARVEKVRVELITKYADEQTDEQKEKGEPIRVTKKLKEFQEEFGPLLDEEVELNCETLPFTDIEDVKLTVQDLASLETWFEIPEQLKAPIIPEEEVKLEEAPAEVPTEEDKTEAPVEESKEEEKAAA